MILSISEQAELFFCVFAAGCAAGVFYDIIEVFRMNFPHKKTMVCIEDLIYWMSVIILLFLFMLEKNYAEIRLFDIIGFFLGMLVYGFLISPAVIKILMTFSSAVKALIKLIIEIILTPIRLIWIPLSYPVKKSAAVVEECFKKVLHLSEVYAKIKLRRIEDQIRFIKRKKK